LQYSDWTVGFTLSERYPDREAVAAATSDDLKRDFVIALTYPNSGYTGVVAGWMSSAITRRSIDPRELRKHRESSLPSSRSVR
jgi:hypothetical protein